MSRVLRVTLAVLTALGLLVLASSYFVSQTLNEWFERDLAGRADLALAGARDKLVEDWSGTSTTRSSAWWRCPTSLRRACPGRQRGRGQRGRPDRARTTRSTS